MKSGVFLKVIVLVVFFLTIVCATIDTHLFVYPSLSRYLLLEMGVAVMAFIVLFAFLFEKRLLSVTKCHLLVLAWVVYVVLRGFIVPVCELYRSVYLCATLLLCLLLSYLERGRWISRSYIENVLLAVAGLNVVSVICQRVGLIASGSAYFEVTGCNENPTVTALYLIGCVQILMVRVKNSVHRFVWVVLLIGILYSVVLLRCRTAYVGLAVEAVVMLYMRYKPLFAKGKASVFYLAVAGVSLLLLAFVAGAKMYDMKKDSADGRLLIWKLTAEMIADNPQGYGYGLFEKHYNLKQADYFAKENYTETERRNATFVYMPYNDYLEHGVEGGVIGMLFLAAFYLLMVRNSVKAKDFKSTAVLLSFAVMSLFNFVYTSILPWLLLVCHASFVIGVGSTLQMRKCQMRVVGVVTALPIMALAICSFSMVVAQLRLKLLGDGLRGNAYLADKQFVDAGYGIATSEAFWSMRAANNCRNRQFADALSNIRVARTYSSLPGLFMMEYRCRESLGDTEAAVACLDTLSYMLPRSLTVKHLLMRHYAESNRIGEALRYADDILSTGFKVQSEKAVSITNQAKHFKKIYGYE